MLFTKAAITAIVLCLTSAAAYPSLRARDLEYEMMKREAYADAYAEAYNDLYTRDSLDARGGIRITPSDGGPIYEDAGDHGGRGDNVSWCSCYPNDIAKEAVSRKVSPEPVPYALICDKEEDFLQASEDDGSISISLQSPTTAFMCKVSVLQVSTERVCMSLVRGVGRKEETSALASIGIAVGVDIAITMSWKHDGRRSKADADINSAARSLALQFTNNTIG